MFSGLLRGLDDPGVVLMEGSTAALHERTHSQMLAFAAGFLLDQMAVHFYARKGDATVEGLCPWWLMAGCRFTAFWKAVRR